MDYVLMAIPSPLVGAVAKLISASVEDRSLHILTEGIDGGVAAANASLINGWTEDLVRRAYKESADPMRQVLIFLAEHAGQEVTSTQIAAAINAKHGWNTVAGMLGAFGRRSVNRYDRPEPMWEFRWGHDAKGYLKMPATVAAVIKKVAAE